MRFFAFIMAILVLGLTSLPCADEEMTLSGTPGVEKPVNSGDSHDDACTPFCHCSCCAGFSINLAITFACTATRHEINHSSSFLPSRITDISLPIWQPPQLA